MNNFYVLDPECAGSLGGDTEIINKDANNWQLKRFQLVLEHWPQDDLTEATLGGYAISARLAKALEASRLTGFTLSEIDIIEGDQLFVSRPANTNELPKLVWLKVTGIPGQHDFGFRDEASKSPLVISDRVLELLKGFKLENCDVSDFDHREMAVEP